MHYHYVFISFIVQCAILQIVLYHDMNPLTTHFQAWKNIGSSNTILKWVLNGIPLQFDKPQKGFHTPNYHLTLPQKHFVNEKIKELLKQGTIRQCFPGEIPLCISPLKCVPKKHNKYRLIVDLRQLNQNIVIPKFKCEGIDTVATQIEYNDLLITADLKDGFYHVPVHKDFQKYLGVEWQGVKYVFCTLPQGLASSPYYFYKILRPVVEYLRENGVRIVLYVDDFILMLKPNIATDHIDLFIHTLQELGWTINFEKSTLIPSKKCTYLGFILITDHTDGIPYIKVTRQRIRRLKKDIKRCLKLKSTTARKLACITGQCVSMTKAILPAKLLLRNAYRTIAKRESWDSVIHLNDHTLKDLTWWQEAIDNWNGAPIRTRPVDVQIASDASSFGWGACIENLNLEASGIWNTQIAHMPSNYRELLAVGLALKSFGPHIRGKSVQILSDNITTVACLNRLYTPSQELGQLVKRVWLEAHAWEVDVQAKYLAGHLNQHADMLSRILSPYQWKLNPQLFNYLDHLWGPHTVDRFASMMTTQLACYNSLYHDPYTSGVDALAQNWSADNNFVNPPFWLIPKILSLVKAQKAHATLIAPYWPAQPWFRQLKSLSVTPPLKIPNNSRAIWQLGALPEPMKNKRWNLFAWRIFGGQN